MSLNITELTPTPTPTNPFSLIPMQSIAVVAVISVIGIALAVLWCEKYYSNMGKKVVFRIHQTPDKRLKISYYFHEIGNPIRTTYKTAEEATEAIGRMLEGMFGEHQNLT